VRDCIQAGALILPPEIPLKRAYIRGETFIIPAHKHAGDSLGIALKVDVGDPHEGKINNMIHLV
jgi:hypothetical protein